MKELCPEWPCRWLSVPRRDRYCPHLQEPGSSIESLQFRPGEVAAVRRDAGRKQRGHICGSAQALIVHEEGDPIGAEGTRGVRGLSSGAAPISGAPLLCLSQLSPRLPSPRPRLPSPDHDIGLEHSSATFSCLPQGHQGILGGQLGTGIAEEVFGKGGGLGTHRPGCCRPSLPHQHSAPRSPWGPLGAPLV